VHFDHASREVSYLATRAERKESGLSVVASTTIGMGISKQIEPDELLRSPETFNREYRATELSEFRVTRELSSGDTRQESRHERRVKARAFASKFPR